MIKLDYSLESTDWIKRGTLDLPTDRKRLEAILGLPKAGADRQARLEQLWMLPIWESLPNDLRAEFNEPFTKGDFEGHPFRGNQWVDANGVSRAGAGSTPDQDRQAYELRQQGKTWDEIARELGYANGGAVRRLAIRHEKRLKDGVVIPPTPDKPTVVEDEKDEAGTTRIKDLAGASQVRAALKILRNEFPDGVVQTLKGVHLDNYDGGSLSAAESAAVATLLKVGSLVDDAVNLELYKELGIDPELGIRLESQRAKLKEAQQDLSQRVINSRESLQTTIQKEISGIKDSSFYNMNKVAEILGLVQQSNETDGVNSRFVNATGEASLPLKGADIPPILAENLTALYSDYKRVSISTPIGRQITDAAKIAETSSDLLRSIMGRLRSNELTVQEIRTAMTDPTKARDFLIDLAEHKNQAMTTIKGQQYEIEVESNKVTGKYNYRFIDRALNNDPALVKGLQEIMESERSRDFYAGRFLSLSDAGRPKVLAQLMQQAFTTKKGLAALNNLEVADKPRLDLIDDELISRDDTWASINFKVKNLDAEITLPKGYSDERTRATKKVLSAMGVKFADVADVPVVKVVRSRGGETLKPLEADEKSNSDAIIPLLPKAFVDGTVSFYRNNDLTTPIRVQMSRVNGRAHAQNLPSAVAISIRKPNSSDDSRWQSIYLHELGHGMEYRNPFIRYAEALFFESRRGGEQPKSLRSITKNPSYTSDETAIEDRWMNSYAGKIYSGAGRQSTYEIFTTGLQNVFFGDEVADADHRDFIFAILAAAGNL